MVLTLFLVVGGGVIAVFVWDFRRKVAEREAVSKKRFEEMLLARPAPASSPGTPAAVVPASGAMPEIKAQAAVETPPAVERFLDPRKTLFYRLLKVGIPDHEIFANVALASVVGGRNEQETRRIAQCRLDFVVCEKGMRVVAAVEFEAAGGVQVAGEQRFKADCLKAAGISMVRINPAALPRREAIRALVCGQAGPAGH